jgi:hypothetical protein
MAKPIFGRLIGAPISLAGLGLCVLLLFLLSLIPGDWQVRTGAPKPLEHVVAYAGTALIYSIATSGKYLVVGAIALGMLSGALELLQFLSPERDPQLIGFLASSLGAIVGMAAGGILVGAVKRRGR